MTPSPDPRSGRRKLTLDELIGILVAFTSLGTIFFWAVRQPDPSFDLSSLNNLLVSPSPSQAPSPTLSPTPAVNPAIVAAPSPSPSASLLPTPQPSTAAPITQAAPLAAIGLSRPAAPSPQSTTSASVIPPGKATKFSDVPASYWASAYIAELTDKGIISGFPDGRFLPDKPVTRAEFAGMLQNAFSKQAIRPVIKFSDVPADYWATEAINQAVETGFLSGYPGGTFRPDQDISRLETQLSLATGLNLQPRNSVDQTLGRYQDSGEVPKYALPKIAAATDAGVAVNYPDSEKLRPYKIASRAEAAALIYKALNPSK